MALSDDDLATWKAFINAHDRITRQINADLTERGLPARCCCVGQGAVRT
jgi:hypothetical protein